MTTEAEITTRGRTRKYINRSELQVGDLLVSLDGNHKIVDIEHSNGIGGTRTHVKLEVRGRVFRQPVYGSRVVWRKDQ